MSKPFVKKPVAGWKVLLFFVALVFAIYLSIVFNTNDTNAARRPRHVDPGPRYADRSERTESEKPKPAPKPKRKERPNIANRSTWSGTWPLTIDGGMLTCTKVLRAGGQPAVYITTRNGDMWPLNGIAKSHHSSFGAKPDIAPIWRNNPDIPGTKVNIGPLIQKGLRLCN